MRGSHLDTTWREKLPPICPGCGYNLTGIESLRCPECGRGVLRTELRDNARTLFHALRQVEDVNDVLNFGVYLVAAAASIVLGFYALGWGVGLARVVGFFLAIAALGSGLQVLRVRRFPDWATEWLPHRPNYQKGIAVILCALAILGLAIFLPNR